MPPDSGLVLPADTGDVSFERHDDGNTLAQRIGGRGGPDVLLLSGDLAGFSGIAGVQAARKLAGARPLGVFAPGASLALARTLFFVGIDAVLPPELAGPELSAAVALLARGRRFVILAPTGSPTGATALPLSEREAQVLQGVCAGLQNKEIAHTINVQEVTVKMHLRAVIRKLGARNRTQAAMIARDLGIV